MNAVTYNLFVLRLIESHKYFAYLHFIPEWIITDIAVKGGGEVYVFEHLCMCTRVQVSALWMPHARW